MEFTAFPKIPRLNRDFVVTEKIDGTNAAVVINEYDVAIPVPSDAHEGAFASDVIDDKVVVFGAQSRNRLITPESDNYGFAAWADSNTHQLYEVLGPGTHFGEWAGPGIQKNPHQLPEKRFFLFNTHRWGFNSAPSGGYPYVLGEPSLGLRVVPVLGLAGDPWGLANIVADIREDLMMYGSYAQDDTDPTPRSETRPEGVIVYHTAARQYFKSTLKNDDTGKWAE